MFDLHLARATLGRREHHELDVIELIRRENCQATVVINPPTPAQTVAHLLDGSTLWRSAAGYRCKPGFAAVVDGR